MSLWNDDHFQQGLIAVYVALKKAFDSVHSEIPWVIFHVCGIPARIIYVLIIPYSWTESTVKTSVIASIAMKTINMNL